MFILQRRLLSAITSRLQGAPEEKTEEQKEAERRELEEQLQEVLLPSQTSQRVACVCNCIKIPVIIAVMVLGTLLHYEMAYLQEAGGHRYYRPTWTDGPSCFLLEFNHERLLEKQLYSYNVTEWFVNQTNMSLDNLSHYNWNFSYRIMGKWDSDYCGIDPEHEDDAESEDQAAEEWDIRKKEMSEKTLRHHCKASVKHHMEDGQLSETTNLLQYITWLIPYPLLWGVYKLLFIGTHPIDRIMYYFTQQPQPIFKLVTEPYFQRCSFFMRIWVALFGYFRYKMMPNVLLLPISSLMVHPDCQDYVFFRSDALVTPIVYIVLIVEMFWIVSAYAVGVFYFKSHFVGTWTYGFLKFLWFLASPGFLVLLIIHTSVVFNKDVLAGLNLMVKLTFEFSAMTLDWNIDVCKILASVIVTMEAVQLFVMIAGIVVPRLPGVGKAAAAYVPLDRRRSADDGTGPDASLPLFGQSGS